MEKVLKLKRKDARTGVFYVCMYVFCNVALEMVDLWPKDVCTGEGRLG